MFRREVDIEGGRTIYGREYISALQNRNKTNLLEALGSAPLIVEELIPEDSESRYMRNQITKSIKGGGDWLGRMSGLSRIPGGLQQIAQQASNRFQSRIEFELQSLFLPLQGFTREILFEYESLTTQYRTGAGIGSFIGGFSGAALGYYYLGPKGAQVLGWIGQVAGGVIGATIERAATGEGGPIFDPFGLDLTHIGPAETPQEPDPSGGLPDITFIGDPFINIIRRERIYHQITLTDRLLEEARGF